MKTDYTSTREQFRAAAQREVDSLKSLRESGSVNGAIATLLVVLTAILAAISGAVAASVIMWVV